MEIQTKDKRIGNKGLEHHVASGLARCGERGTAGAASSSVSDCYRIGTWNVRSLHQAGKMANVLQEMVRMDVDIMGVAETFWKEDGEFMTELPDVEEKFKVIYSGGEKNRRGVGIILRGKVGNSVLLYRPISERILVMRLKGTPVNVLIIQVYAPNEDGDEKDKEQFYEMLDQVIVENRKGNECLMVMGDFNGKVGKNKEEDIVGPYGLGERNENGQLLVEFCKRHNLFVTNTWFQQRTSAQYTWTSPDGNIKNQIDYVLIDKRYRNEVKNSKSHSQHYAWC